MSNLIRSIWRDESGQDLVEYVLIIVLIALAVVGALSALGTEVENVFNNAEQQLQTGS